METYKSDLYGDLACPRSFNELMNAIFGTERKEGRVPVYVWRGQSSVEWPLHSGAVRRMLESSKRSKSRADSMFYEVSESNMRYYEESLLMNAEHQGYRFFEGRRLCDLELLTLLQHYGAATRLIDFTENMLVGLWFASEDPRFRDDYGVLFGLHTDHLVPLNLDEEMIWKKLSVAQIIDDVEDVKNGASTKSLATLAWKPPPIFKRIVVQHSLFVFSQVISARTGSLAVQTHRNATLQFAVSPQLKREMVELWRPVFNYSRQELFPDLEGFAAFNSASVSMSEMFRW